MLSHKKLTTDGFSLEADGRYIALMNPAVPGKEANARRLVACWNEHDGLVHDNARLYQSLQGEMQGRLKAEQERDEAVEALRETQRILGLTRSAEEVLAKHKVSHDQ